MRINATIRPGVPAARHTPDTHPGHDWRHSAACPDEEPDLFFPVGNTGPSLLQIEEAKAVCRRCPVMQQCLQWAMDNPRLADHGVWGGLSEDERRTIRRRATRTRQETTHLATWAASRPADTDATRREVVRDMWKARHTDVEIGAVLGLTKQAVGHIRRGLGLQAHRPSVAVRGSEGAA